MSVQFSLQKKLVCLLTWYKLRRTQCANINYITTGKFFPECQHKCIFSELYWSCHTRCTDL